ncbi:MAG: prephenate dehydrogenase/arogenate dehydrogenase family protein [Actinomycetota bacterium]
MKVAIIGTGLIGGSIGLALKRSTGATVIAFDQDPSTAARAVERGAADGVARTAGEAAAGCDFVFIATPVGAIARTALEISEVLAPGAVMTDVGSTKDRVVVEVDRSLREGSHFIGGHPMAGTEEEGIEAADGSLFEGSWWILTPTDRSDPAAYQRLHALLTTLGARIMALKPSEHDELMAIISHVPQLTATALMNLAAERGRDHAALLALAAGGFRDVTRVAASNPDIWLDICRENGDAIASTLERFAEGLLALRDLIKENDAEGLRAAFLRARESRRSLPGKTVAGDVFEVTMPVPDRPGVLAQVTTSIGNLGVNIEDLQITHSTEGGRGVLHLTIGGDDQARRATEALRAQGFDAREIRL